MVSEVRARYRCSKRELAAAKEVVEELSVWRPSHGRVLERVLPLLLRLLDAQFVGCYQPMRASSGWTLEYGNGLLGDGTTPERVSATRTALSQVLEASPPEIRLAQVPRSEQNQVVSMRERMSNADWLRNPITRHVIPALGLDSSCYDIRVLCANQGLLLGWCGAYQATPFTPVQKAQMRQIVPVLREQAMLERRVGQVALLDKAFVAALDAIPQPAYLVDAAVRIRYANGAGRQRFERGKSNVLESLNEWVRAASANSSNEGAIELSQATVTPLLTDGVPPHYLVIESPRVFSLDSRLARVAKIWRLTPRQLEILKHLAAGDSNKDIALRLACSLRTVEHHISIILNKSGSQSRAAVIGSLVA